MAKLIKCKHCDNMIAKKAKVCPQCGGKNKQTSTPTKLVLVLFVAVLIGYMLDDTPQSVRDARKAERERVAAKVKKQKAEECRKNKNCWIEKNEILAYNYAHLIEKRAKYQHRWESGDRRFTRYGLDEKTGYITYQGDQVSFQNGFGAWERQFYTMVVDPATERMVSLKVSAGRLP